MPFDKINDRTTIDDVFWSIVLYIFSIIKNISNSILNYSL